MRFILITILSLTCFLFLMEIISTDSEASVSRNGPERRLFNHISKNNKDLPESYRMKLTYALNKAATKHKISAKLLSAILMQESRYKVSAVGYVKKKPIDFGISQINIVTIKSFKFSKYRLLSDLDYSVNAGAKVLADFKRMYGKKESNWWSRYNSSANKHRVKYQRAVTRYL